ncbi:PRC-barrel domain-containing protein [Hoeflea sp. G2-23]|uniref:PRC-barrel domain-containing protein n=1 Tax=Hoeflea algicola TaxID=2983763 RepID=A0ABT3Z7B7_9HYPH|nr:PRC-barrel domain-containing protein [Hoeflea algicola]MCY0147669.1 PRC-barrel domain-containing protein [Hoeflea algicola]
MIKTLLASTALVALVSTSAMAASHTEANPAAATSETVVMTDQDAAMLTGSNLASTLIGSSVYASSAEDAEVIGDINDIVVTAEGKVGSLIVGVGGFLGLGEKDVAVNYDQIEWVDRDGDRWLVANMSREQLEAAPAFDRDMIYADARSTDEGVDATQKMAADTEKAPAEDVTAEKIESGESAVETAENKTMGIDRSAMTSVTTEDLSADNLIGRAVYSANDDNIGEIGDVLLSADNKVEGFVLDVGGFLGMGEKEVAISPENLDIRADADGNLTVFTPFTQEQLEAQPEYSEETWKSNRDDVIMIVPAG